ncbi:MAG TPA: TonB-dependent receptor [Verrucomicrobiae bacterium]|nr:TonB-dependent receptor [Verrucomicrobiae bacterium]
MIRVTIRSIGNRARAAQISQVCAGALIAAFAAFHLTGASAAPSEPALAGTVLTVEGTVEIARTGETQWTAVSTNVTLGFGDSLRTASQSRATVRLSDLSVIRVNEKTVLEIRPQDTGNGSRLDLQTGSTYFFHRSKPASVEFQTPLISGAIRGTEFNLSAETNSGPTTVTLIEGQVALNNSHGQLVLNSGEQGTVDPGQAPRKTAVINAINIIQWSLYYPAVLDPDEIGLSDAEKSAQSYSLAAYRSGDLLAALKEYPKSAPTSDALRVQHAALLLSVGQVDETEAALKDVPASASSLALREVIAAVKHQEFSRSSAPQTASEWLAESYYQQSRSQLKPALAAARSAVAKSPKFGFAWVRVAELEFSLGHADAAKTALDRGLELSPRNAQALTLKGFILASQNRTREAAASFDDAISTDGALANAWLGRGLCRIHEGHVEAGRNDIQVAATLEPNRAELRNYLGKAWIETHDPKHAEKELALAKQFDPADPTPWLYSALLNFDYNQDNQAIHDLEKSKELNNNRSVFRSKLLLDQDQAVRGANLAKIYQDDGMFDVSVRESAQAVDNDYANYSAHLFLANSYDALRDPKRINLRYETPWFSQLLVADLLAPVGGVSLSQNVSQQEYSRLFDGDHVGVYNDTQYTSRGDWLETASVYGNVDNTGFSLDVFHQTENGFRANNDLQDNEFTAKFKQQITPQDSVFLEVSTQNTHSGDLNQYYSQSQAISNLRVSEEQEPNLFIGYHREWAPGVHTLILAGRLQDDFSLNSPTNNTPFISTGAVPIPGFSLQPFPFTFQSELVAYTAELQQIFQTDSQTLVLGARYQTGDLQNMSALTNTLQIPAMSINQSLDAQLKRVTGYGYYSYRVVDPLLLTAALNYDHLEYPDNDERPPIAGTETSKDQVSPKLGFRWTPLEHSTFRGAWTRSLGGVFYDTSVRLEPTEIAGFNDAFRSILPESIAGLVPGSRFETYDLAFDQELPATRTYFSVVAELLKSTGETGDGAIRRTGPINPMPFELNERLDYADRSLSVIVNQLLGDEFAVGASYRIDLAKLDNQFLGTAIANPQTKATLQQVNLYALFNHRCGFFSKVEAVWSAQSNSGYTPDIPGDDFVQVNAFAGYRLPRRLAEMQVGVLNIGNRDYNLNPLTLYTELPRERTFVAEFKFNF